MTGDPYSARVREYFMNPLHAGDLAGGVCTDIDAQGVRLRLAATTSDGQIRRLRFRAWGCPHLIAAAEACCAACEDKPVAVLESFSASELMQSLPVPAEKTGRILVLEDAARSLGQLLGHGSGRGD